MVVTAVYDANVLFPNTLRDLLIRVAQADMVRAKWTEAILDEMLTALTISRPGIPANKLLVLRNRMNAAVLRPLGIEALSPDDFIHDLIDIDGKIVWACGQQIADSRRNPPEGVEDILSQLERSGLVESVAALRMS